MPSGPNPFQFLTQTQLEALQTSYLAAITAVATGAQSYSLNGVQVSRANLDALNATLGQIGLALRIVSGTAVRTAYPITRPLFPAVNYSQP